MKTRLWTHFKEIIADEGKWLYNPYQHVFLRSLPCGLNADVSFYVEVTDAEKQALEEKWKNGEVE